MKIKTALFFLAFCLCILILGCAKKEIKNTDSQGKNIICFGDSITFGYGVGQGEDYPDLLSQMLNMPVINAGVSGETTADALQRLDKDVLDKEPLLVIIEFGGNDFLNRMPLVETVNNMRKIIDKIQSRGSMVAVMDISTGLFLAGYRSAFARLATEENAIFIPGAVSGIITNPSLKSDFMHPNVQGYRMIAQRVRRSLLPYINQNLRKRELSR